MRLTDIIRLTKNIKEVILIPVINMVETELLNDIRPHVKDMVEEAIAASFKSGEMRELLEDLALARAMQDAENEKALTREEALKQIRWK